MDFKDIQLISYNPFLGSKMVAHFLSGCHDYTIRRELMFLLFPFIHKKGLRDILRTANTRTTLHSAFFNDSKKKVSLAGIEKRYHFFKELTQKSLIVAASDFSIDVSDNLIMNEPIDYSIEKDELLKNYYKGSHYLGKILSQYELRDIYIKLGLKEI